MDRDIHMRLKGAGETIIYGGAIWLAISGGFALFFGWSNSVAVMAAELVAFYALPFAVWQLFIDHRP